MNNPFIARTTAVSIKKLITATAATWCIVTASAQELVGPAFDWQVQDYHDTLAATNCYIDPGTGELVVDLDLRPEEGYRSGEVLLDLKYTPGIQYPTDLEGRTVTVQIDVPHGFYGDSSRPNGIQLALKTGQNGWPSTYYTWRNASPGRHTLQFNPTSRPGFDAKQSRILVIKMGLGSGSQDTFVGQIRIRSAQIDPPVTKAIPPWPSPIECAPTGDITVDGTTFTRAGRPFVLTSVNLRPLEYGAWGYNDWFPGGYGPSKHPAWIDFNFDLLARAGHTAVRMEFLTDGRSLFNADGSMKPFSAFEADLQVVFSAAARHGLVIELSLLDFLIAGPARQVSGVQVQGYSDLLTDPNLRAQFIAGIVVPLLQEFGTHAGFFGLDALNEVDWIVAQNEGGDWESVNDATTKAPIPISIDDFRAYVAALRAAIDEYAPRVLLTAGVSATSFQSLIVDGGIYPYISFASIHHYDWMQSHIGTLEDFVASLTLNIPLVIDEYPATSQDSDQYRRIVDSGAVSGLAVWNASVGTDTVAFQSDEEFYSYLESHREFSVNTILRNSRPHIDIQSTNSGHEIQWNALPGIQYALQVSTDLAEWEDDQRHTGNGLTSASIPALANDSRQQFFRLLLKEVQ